MSRDQALRFLIASVATLLLSLMVCQITRLVHMQLLGLLMRFLFVFQVNSCDRLSLPMRIVIIDYVDLIFDIDLRSVHVQ